MSLHDPMDTETLANELARQGALLQEAQQAVLRLEQLTIQADERSKVAEDTAIDAVTAISMVQIPDQKKVKVSNRDAEKFWPETYTADRVDKKSFAEFLGAGTWPVGETPAGVGWCFPRPADRVE